MSQIRVSDLCFGYEGSIAPQAVTIFWQIRFPRILSAVLIGASLAVAGAAYQGMFRNPMVSPDILGASTGAGFGAAGEGYFRLTAFNSEENTRRAVERIISTI